MLTPIENKFENLEKRIRHFEWLEEKNFYKKEEFEKILFGIFIFGIFIFYPQLEHKKPVQQQYTTEEIEKAKNDIELALSYFYYYTSKTEILVEKEILPDYLTKPIKTILKQF
jgi:hypothetical protein